MASILEDHRKRYEADRTVGFTHSAAQQRQLPVTWRRIGYSWDEIHELIATVYGDIHSHFRDGA